MDSLTQIVLGAAVGEVCLGKKLGNRAMVWGAVGGTIPDLDVPIGEVFMNEIDSLAFHRSLTHSLAFSVVFPLVMASITNYIYKKSWYRITWVRILFYILSVFLIGGVLFGVNAIVHNFSRGVNFVLLGLSVLALLWFAYRWYKRYVKRGHDIVLPSYLEWYLLFFWAFFTHVLLDSFTAYGTQVFWPFSNWRVAFNNIAVADPMYTLPFLILLVVASAFYRKERRRALFNFAGIAISSFYMVLTLINHFQVKNTFRESLKNQEIEYERLLVTPTILNNALWNGIAHKEPDTYYYGRYSIFDEEKRVEYFKVLDGNHELLQEYDDFEAYQTLQWFSDDYYILEDRDSCYVFNDLRYGTMNDEREEKSEFVFSFELKPNEEDFDVVVNRGSDNDSLSMSEQFGILLERIKGI